jgi:DNA-binding NarL/FixJ family response regulator
MAEAPRFLVIGDSRDEYSLQLLCEMLSELGVVRVIREDELTGGLEEQAYDAVILDAGAVAMPATAVTRILQQSPSTEVYVITASPHWRVARDVLRAGAADYMPKSRLSEDLFDSLRGMAQRSTRSGWSPGGDGHGS